MLFLGSSKYPDHSIFGNIVARGGGFDNAFTSNDETNYYFVSGNNEFEEALEIFSWFFKDPVLDSKSIQKEVQNVNSEHRKNINNDDWRVLNLVKSAANSSTSYSDFSTGTQETLWDTPVKNNIDMSNELRSFYLKYYSANLMKLVILGNRTIDELEKLATEKFINVTNVFKIAPQSDFGYSGVKLPLEIRFLPSSEKNSVHLLFPIEIDLHKNAESQPFVYIILLYSYSGKASFIQKLKSLGYLLDIEFGKSIFSSWAVFEIEMILTDKGMENYEFILEIFLSWTRYISTIYTSNGIWSVMQKLSENSFLYASGQSSKFSETADFASRLHKTPFKYVYSGDRVFFTKDDSIVRQILDQIKFENWIVVLGSYKMANQSDPLATKFNKTDQYYGTEYIQLEYPTETIKKIRNGLEINGKLFNDKNSDSIIVNDYFIPSENSFIPSNLDMICPDRWLIVRVRSSYMDECSEQAFLADGDSIESKLVFSNKKGEMWFKQDRSFLAPLANIKIRIETDKGNVNLEEYSIMFFFEEYLAEWIRDNLYEAVDVGYSFEFHSTTNGIEFEIYGYNDKIIQVVKALLKSFRNFVMTENEFARIKEKSLNVLIQKKSTTIYKNAVEMSKSLIKEYNWTFDQIADECQNITLSDVQTFMNNFFDHAYVKSLVHGNIASEQAISLLHDIEKILNFGVLENYWDVKEKVRILDAPYAIMPM